ncbi:hypothetical protein ACFVWG_14125 [Kribbella sp. NPDC058245]|uniref:hypothetical protein n=1 Tax=Kribbella sp. NPDC058245 TaxID=3346399 RepID=UPI0036E7DD80
MAAKHKLSVTVDRALIEAARAAVAAGRAASVSAWVNDALRRELASEQRRTPDTQ